LVWNDMIRREHSHDTGRGPRSDQGGPEGHRRAGIPPHRLGDNVFLGQLWQLFLHLGRLHLIRDYEDVFLWHHRQNSIHGLLQEGPLSQKRDELLRCFFAADRPESLALAACHDNHKPVPCRAGAFLHTAFTASTSVLVNSLTFSTRFGVPPCSAIWFTIALPTTTASALSATVLACSGLDIPKPTAMGRLVC